MVYLVQRGDAKQFTLASDIDTNYAQAFAKARAAGVEALACRCQITPAGIAIKDLIPIIA